MSWTPETTDLNYAMQSKSVKISSQRTFERLKVSLSWFNFEMVWATLHKLCRKSSHSSGNCLPMIAHVDIDMVPVIFQFSFSPLRRILHSTTQVRYVSRSWTAGYPGCPLLCWVTRVHMGIVMKQRSIKIKVNMKKWIQVKCHVVINV